MPDRSVFWKAYADFSNVRQEAARTEASLAALQAQTKESNAANTKLGSSEDDLAKRVSSSGAAFSVAANKVSSGSKKVQEAADKSAAAQKREASAIEKVIAAQNKRVHLSIDDKIKKETAETEKLIKAQNKLAGISIDDKIKKETAAWRQEEAATRRVISTNEKLRQQLSKIVAEQRAMERAAQAVQPIGVGGVTPNLISGSKGLIAQKAASVSLTREETAAANALSRAEDSLNNARARQSRALSSLHILEENLLGARSRQAVAGADLRRLETEYHSALRDTGSSASDVASAENALLQGRLRLEQATAGAHAASNRFELGQRRLGVVESEVAGAADRTRLAIERVGQTFNAGGGSGNRFTNVLDGIANHFEKSSGGAKSFGMALGLIKIPLIVGGVYELLSALSALVSGLFALASAVSPAIGALAALGPVLFAVGGAMAVVRTAFAGVGNTLRAYTASQQKAAVSGNQAANSAISNAEAVNNAQHSLAQARANVAITAHQGAEAMASAAHDIVQSNQAQLDSEKALIQARIDAKNNIIDLKNAAIDAALAEQGATLGLAQSKEDLQRVLNDPTATRLQREQAELAVKQAQQQQKESKRTADQSAKDSKKATAAGVGGSTQVKQARRDEKNAIYQLQQAQQRYADTVAQTSRDNKQALYAVSQAEQSLADAQRQAATATSAAAHANALYNYQLNKLPPAAKKFVLHLISMKHYWTDLKNTAASALFPGLNKSLDLLPKLVPTANRLFKSLGTTLGGLALRFTQMITSNRWLASFGQLSKASSPILKTLGDAFFHLLDALRAVLVAAIPMTEQLSKGADVWAKHIDAMANAPGAYQKMVGWFHRSYLTLHQLGQIFKNIIIGIHNTGKAAMDSGKDMLNSIQRITKHWANWTATINGQNAMHDYFDRVRANMKTIDAFLGRLGRGFINLGANKGLSPIINSLHNLWQSIKDAFKGSGIQQAIADIINNIASALRSMAGLGSIFVGFIKGLAAVTAGLAWFLKHPMVAHIVGSIAIAFGAYKALKFAAAITGIGKLTGALSRYTKAALALPAGATVAQRMKGGFGFAVPHIGKAGAAATGAGEGIAAEGAVARLGSIGSKLGSVAKVAFNPWTLAIAAVVTALVLLYTKSKAFRDFVHKVFTALGKLISTIWNDAIKPAVMGIVDFFKRNSDGFKKLFGAIGNIIKAVTSIFTNHGNTWQRIITIVSTAFKVGFAIIAFWIKIVIWVLNKLATVIAWVINTIIVPIINFLVTVIRGGFKIIAWAIGAVIDVAKAFARFCVLAFKAVIAVNKLLWDAIKVTFRAIGAIIMWFVHQAEMMWHVVSKYFIALASSVGHVVSNIINFFGDLWDSVRTVWNDITGFISDAWNTVWDTLKNSWKTFWGYITGAWNAAASTFADIWNSIGDVISNIWHTIEQAFADAVNFVTQDIINPLIRAIDAVIGVFGLHIDEIPKLTVGGGGGSTGGNPNSGTRARTGPQALAKGGIIEQYDMGGVRPRYKNPGYMLPGYTPGRDPHEFVSNTGLRIRLSGGEGILVPEATRALGGRRAIEAINRTYSSRLPSSNNSFAGGGLVAGMDLKGTQAQQEGYAKWALWRTFVKNNVGFGSGLVNTVTDAVDLVRKGLGWVAEHGLALAESPLRALVNQIDVPIMKKVINGLFDKVNKGVHDLIAGHSGESTWNPHDDAVKYTGQINDQGARGSVMMSGFVLNNMTGVDGIMDSDYDDKYFFSHQSLFDALDTIIKYESGWNASAQNNWDSNAKAGHPSQGLMQTIPTTYEAYVNPNLDRGIKDAASNVAAGVGYANSRYGGVESVPGIVAVRRGGSYVGYNRGGVLKLHQGGVVPGLWKHAGKNRGLSALIAQSGLGFPYGKSDWWYALTQQYKKRLSGVTSGTDVAHTGSPPYVQRPFSFDSKETRNFTKWLDDAHPQTYGDIWQNQSTKNSSMHNAHHRNPLFPILSYMGNAKAFENWRLNKNLDRYRQLAKADRKADKASHISHGDNYYSLTAEKKRHAGWAEYLMSKRARWDRKVGLIKSGKKEELTNVSTLRALLHLSGSGSNDGLFSSDMQIPADHAAAHALKVSHPADWAHPWAGPVTDTEKALAQQDRSNTLNKEWYDLLRKISSWGYTYLVDYLLEKGVTDGMSIARDAVKHKKTAEQLDKSIAKGKGIPTISGSANDSTMIFKAIAKLASGKASHPYGLRDVSADQQVPDYAIVNLYTEMTSQLKDLPSELTRKFNSDVKNFRLGLFYANRGAVVPGQGTTDSQPALLTPGEGVLSTVAMRVLGLDRFAALNRGEVPRFAHGGIALAPSIASGGLLGEYSAHTNYGNIRGGNENSSESVTYNIHTEINNPVGEASIYSQNKALARQAALGTFRRK